MTNSQVNWAKVHDWFVKYDFINQMVIVRDDSSPTGELQFSTFKELTTWAGHC
jgi:hypothetical protein